MRRLRSLACVILVGTTIAVAASPAVRIASRRSLVDHASMAYEKTIVIGIVADEGIRHHFEDKFVTHLRVKRLPAVTSYSLVPSLRQEADREKVMAAIDEQHIDAAIAVRLLTLPKGADAEELNARWEHESWGDRPLRDLIGNTLETPLEKAKEYSVEVTLWDPRTVRPVWVARTDAIPRKQLEKSGGELIQQVIRTLQDDGLLPSDDELDRRARSAP